VNGRNLAASALLGGSGIRLDRLAVGSLLRRLVF
jgi:hypothetical protein